MPGPDTNVHVHCICIYIYSIYVVLQNILRSRIFAPPSGTKWWMHRFESPKSFNLIEFIIIKLSCIPVNTKTININKTYINISNKNPYLVKEAINWCNWVGRSMFPILAALAVQSMSSSTLLMRSALLLISMLSMLNALNSGSGALNFRKAQ